MSDALACILIGLSACASPSPSGNSASLTAAINCECRDAESASLALWARVKAGDAGWRAVADSNVQLQCYDSCGLGEYAAATVQKLLIDRWDDFGTLSVLCRTDARLKSFVLTYVRLFKSDDIHSKIEHNARHRCPSGEEALCSEIVAALSK